MTYLRSKLGLDLRDDVHLALVTTRVLQDTVAQSEQGIVAPATHIVTRVEMSAALTNDDIARLDLLTCEHLAAQTLSMGITAIPSGSEAFLVCHLSYLRDAIRSSQQPYQLPYLRSSQQPSWELPSLLQASLQELSFQHLS